MLFFNSAWDKKYILMKEIKKQFSIFNTNPNLVYLDSAATALMPDSVREAIDAYNKEYKANIHRGLYAESIKATEVYEAARKTIADFLHADSDEIIFTSGTTMSLNLLAKSSIFNLQSSDNIVLTRLEHHANLIPWQQLAKKTGIELRFIELTDNGEIDFASAKKLIDSNTKIVSCTLISNAIGAVVPAKEIIVLAKKVNAITIIDAAQAVGHVSVDVKDFDCDFLAFSGHKVYGPTGIGVLYGKKERLDHMEPFFFGGDMIRSVSYESAEWADAPQKFEAGTPNISGAIGLGAAIDFIKDVGIKKIQDHETELSNDLINQLSGIEGVQVVGPKAGEERSGIVSFTIDGVHPHDAAELLGGQGIAVRAGHHCAMPLMKYLDISGTVRASMGVYTTKEDIDALVEGVELVQKIFSV